MNDVSLDHERHDPLLIAAHAAGDLSDRDADRAKVLVRDCARCAEVAADLGVLATAVRDLPTPARPRDFTITPLDAARLRRRGWRRLGDLLHGDTFRLARPVGAALASLGLAGLVFASMTGGIGHGGAGSTAAPSQAAGVYEQVAAPEDVTTTAGDGGARAGGQASPAGLDAQPMTDPDGETATEPDIGADAGADAAAGTPVASTPNEAMVVLSGSLFIVGIGLFGLRWTADRLGDG